LMSYIPLQHISHVEPAPALKPPAIASDTTAAVATAPEPLAAKPPEPRVNAPKPPHVFNEHVTHPAASSEEVKALIAAINHLQNNMKAMQDQQAELRQELHARQQLELRVRLRWIANPQSQLPQIASFWQDIALLPLLSESERHKAKTMQKLAADDADKLDMWSKRLKQLAATLPLPQHRDIIPKPKNPAFSWLTGKFHLHPAPTPEQQALSELRTRLLNVSHELNVEIWPEHKAWRHLLGDLREQFGDNTELSLPDRLDSMQKDIATIRATAASWLEQL